VFQRIAKLPAMFSLVVVKCLCRIPCSKKIQEFNQASTLMLSNKQEKTLFACVCLTNPTNFPGWVRLWDHNCHKIM